MTNQNNGVTLHGREAIEAHTEAVKNARSDEQIADSVLDNLHQIIKNGRIQAELLRQGKWGQSHGDDVRRAIKPMLVSIGRFFLELLETFTAKYADQQRKVINSAEKTKTCSTAPD